MERRGSEAPGGEGKGGKDERRPSEPPAAGAAGEDGDVSTEEAIQLLTACQGEDWQSPTPSPRPSRARGRPQTGWPGPSRPLDLAGLPQRPHAPAKPTSPPEPPPAGRRTGAAGERERERECAQATDRRVRPALLHRCPPLPAAVQA